jgi:hypothetical protein
VDLFNGVALASLRPEPVLRRFQRAGYRRIGALADIRRLALWEVDEVAESLVARYVALGAALGGATLGLGSAGALVDLPAAIALAMRAIDESAMHYGFDPACPEERAFARRVLAAALSPAGRLHGASFEPVVHTALTLARLWQRRSSGGFAFGRLAFEVAGKTARAIAARTRRSRSSVRRIATRGANASTSSVTVGSATRVVLGAAATAWLLAGVARAAQRAYRERFLLRAPRPAPRGRRDDTPRSASPSIS